MKIPALPKRYILYAPRSYFLIVNVTIPLLVLIVLGYFCGCMVAVFEMKDEVMQNNQALASMYINNQTWFGASDLVRTSGAYCLDMYLGQIGDEQGISDVEKLRNYLEDCGAQYAKSEMTSLYGYNGLHADTSNYILSFGWTSCPYKGKYEYPVESTSDQKTSIYCSNQWKSSFERLKQEQTANGVSEIDAEAIAIEGANGFSDCKPHHLGGALFFFTVFTTIGYGTFSPSSVAGRCIVMIPGAILIVMFAAVNANAGSICLTIFDEFAERKKCYKLTKGVGAPLFWFVILLCWYFFFALLMLWLNATNSDKLSLFDAIWFTFITMTTVGLGDIALTQPHYSYYDMIYVPFLICIGFVCLANFFLKLFRFLQEAFPRDVVTDMNELLRGEYRENALKKEEMVEIDKVILCKEAC